MQRSEVESSADLYLYYILLCTLNPSRVEADLYFFYFNVLWTSVHHVFQKVRVAVQLRGSGSQMNVSSGNFGWGEEEREGRGRRLSRGGLGRGGRDRVWSAKPCSSGVIHSKRQYICRAYFHPNFKWKGRSYKVGILEFELPYTGGKTCWQWML